MELLTGGKIRLTEKKKRTRKLFKREQVILIRECSEKFTSEFLASVFDTTPKTICEIVRKATYKNVE